MRSHGAALRPARVLRPDNDNQGEGSCSVGTSQARLDPELALLSSYPACCAWVLASSCCVCLQADMGFHDAARVTRGGGVFARGSTDSSAYVVGYIQIVDKVRLLALGGRSLGACVPPWLHSG